MDFTFDYHVVDRIPFGAHVARRDEAGHVHVYLSREAGIDQLAVGLAAIQGVAVMEYVCHERHAVAS